MKLTTKMITQGRLDVIVGDDGHSIGNFVMDVDGYFYFLDTPNTGLSSSHTLRLIADLLDEVNKPWDYNIVEYFKNNP